jgi:hypothetical protein
MSRESQELHSEVIKYLKDEALKKLSSENEIRTTKNKILKKLPFLTKNKYSRKGFEIQKKFSIIPAKSNFFLSMQNAEQEISGISIHAIEVCKISRYSKDVLKECEDYLQMKLEVHTDKKLILIGWNNSLIFGSLAFFFLVGADIWLNYIKHDLFLEKISAAFALGSGLIFCWSLSKIFTEWDKPNADEKYLNSTISYRYCMLILKSAQSRINDQNSEGQK